MFVLGLLIGIYSYSIFILGILNLLKPSLVFIATIFFLMFISIYLIKSINLRILLKTKLDFIEKLLLLIIFLLVIINFIGTLGPELAFDALWYHLTIPKIFIQNLSIFYINGGLFYYSVMPKLIDLLFIPNLMFIGEGGAKLTHFLFGILTGIVVYLLSRKFFDKKLSFFAVIIFYSNLVVGWQLITAYIDLGRAFYEILALTAFINWIDTKKTKWLLTSAIVLGLAISTKLIAAGSLVIFIGLIIALGVKRKTKLLNILKSIILYVIFSLIVVLPWLTFAYLNTGNPIYPIFSEFFPISINSSLNVLASIKYTFLLFIRAADSINPIYIILLPLLFFVFKKFNFKLKLIVFYVIFSFFVLILLPNTGGARFVMPYLSAFSILIAGIINNINNNLLKKYLVFLVIFIAFTTFFYRGVANFKYVPVLIGSETKDNFLTNNLNFDFGDFYDVDRWFANNIKEEDKILLIGFHNLYYIDFPFIHESYLKKSDKFNYIAIQNAKIPNKFKDWELVFENGITNVKVYKE